MNVLELKVYRQLGEYRWELRFRTGSAHSDRGYPTLREAMDNVDFHLRHMKDPEA